MSPPDHLPRAMHALEHRGWRRVEPPRRPVLFVNPQSGGSKATRAGLIEHARDRGIETVVLHKGMDLASLAEARIAEGADALGIAGGDGSLAVVASAALARGLPFVCLPAGTRNHFALDLGIDRRDLVGALDAFTDGMERTIDVAEVNGRLFLNNVSLGVYGDAVQLPAYRDAKLRTVLDTAREVLGPSGTLPPLKVIDDQGREHFHAIILLVSNNPYAVQLPGVSETRAALDTGKLGIILLEPPGEGPPGPGRAWTASTLEVTAASPLPAGIDGEAVTLEPPVRFASRPASLRVRISAHHPGVSPSGRLVALAHGPERVPTAL